MRMIVFILISLILSFCTSKRDEGINQILFEKKTNLKLPDTVVSFQGEEESAMNYFLYGRVELTNDQMDTFLKENNMLTDQMKNFDSLNFLAYKPKGDWWDYTGENKSFVNKNWKNEKWNSSLNLAIQKLQNSYLLYIVYFEEP